VLIPELAALGWDALAVDWPDNGHHPILLERATQTDLQEALSDARRWWDIGGGTFGWRDACDGTGHGAFRACLAWHLDRGHVDPRLDGLAGLDGACGQSGGVFL
jgi:hypothetical protein